MRSVEESQAYRTLMFHAIRNFRPLNVLFELTYQCNLNCVCCYNVKHKEKLLSLEEYDDLFGQLRQAGTFLVTLSGGEPLMRKDIFDIIKLVKKHGFAFRIFTNGALLDEEKVLRLKELGPAGFELSLWGSNPELNDRLMGKKGAFEGITNAIKLLVKHELPVTVKTTVCAENYKDFNKIKPLIEDLGADFRYSLVLTLKTDGDTGNIRYRMNEEQFHEFYKIHDAEYDPSELERDKIDDEVLRANSDLPNYLCLAGISTCAVDPFGNITPCVDIPESVGNIREESFDKIWNEAPLLKQLRSLTKDDATDCKGCKYINSCHRCPGISLMEENSLLSKYDYACLLAKVDHDIRKK